MNDGCNICELIGRSPRTPNVVVDGRNLREEVLRFETLPVPNKDEPEHYLPPAAARAHIDSNKMTADDLRALIPTSRKEGAQ